MKKKRHQPQQKNGQGYKQAICRRRNLKEAYQYLLKITKNKTNANKTSMKNILQFGKNQKSV
jgi:hypothetical protein